MGGCSECSKRATGHGVLIAMSMPMSMFHVRVRVGVGRQRAHWAGVTCLLYLAHAYRLLHRGG